MSNNLQFVGRIASAPEMRKSGDVAITKFTLIRDEYAGKDAQNQAKKRQVTIQFTAFRGMAESIVNHGMVGDQLIVTARIENNNYKDSGGNDQYGFNFIVEGFEWGAPDKAKRQALANRPAGQEDDNPPF